MAVAEERLRLRAVSERGKRMRTKRLDPEPPFESESGYDSDSVQALYDPRPGARSSEPSEPTEPSERMCEDCLARDGSHEMAAFGLPTESSLRWCSACVGMHLSL